MTSPQNESQIVTDALATQIVQNTKVHLNLAQDTIVITEDRLKLCLITHLNRLEEKKGWVAPAGILVTIIATFTTTTFRDFMLEALVWKAIFIVAGIINLVWLIMAAIQSFNSPSIENVVTEMKNAGKQSQASV